MRYAEKSGPEGRFFSIQAESEDGMDEPKRSHGRRHARQSPHKHFEPGMTQQLLELRFRQMVLMKQLVHNLIQYPSLLAGRFSDALRIKHHNDGKSTSQCENR